MVRLLIVLACLAFILSLGTGSVAHAVASIDCSATSPTIAAEDGAEEGGTSRFVRQTTLSRRCL